MLVVNNKTKEVFFVNATQRKDGTHKAISYDDKRVVALRFKTNTLAHDEENNAYIKIASNDITKFQTIGR